MTSFLSPLNRAEEVLMLTIRELTALSEALDMAGNEKLAASLSDEVRGLKIARELIDKGRTDALNVYVRAIEQGTANMVNATLAVLEAKMLDKQKGNFVVECDGCGEVLETDTSSFEAARNTMQRAGWKPKKEGEEWKHYCSTCK